VHDVTDPLTTRLTTGGRPLPDMRVRIVDPLTGADLPPGVTGELLYRGPTMFDGYYGDPRATADRIGPDGWFHTGDLCVLDGDGRLTFISRFKDMLKVGGENVAAAEVEDCLLKHPAVAVVQVVAAPDRRYVEVPAAFVQLRPGAAASEPELVDFCRRRISTVRVPRYVRFVTEWPMSETKIQKSVLRQWIAEDLARAGITAAARIKPLDQDR